MERANGEVEGTDREEGERVHAQHHYRECAVQHATDEVWKNPPSIIMFRKHTIFILFENSPRFLLLLFFNNAILGQKYLKGPKYSFTVNIIIRALREKL